jgi:hypothetical protein
LAKTRSLDTVFPPSLTQHLQTDTDAQHGLSPRQACINNLIAAGCQQPIHHCRKSSHTGDNESMSIQRGFPIPGESHRGPRVFEGFDSGVDVARTVVEDNDVLGHD